jgi:hypothetical protein
MNDRVTELSGAAGPHRHLPVRGTGRSAEVIRFILPPPRHARAPTDFPTIAFRAAVQPKDFAATHADTTPCEIVPFEYDET